jgi:dienelactone hydrolase
MQRFYDIGSITLIVLLGGLSTQAFALANPQQMPAHVAEPVLQLPELTFLREHNDFQAQWQPNQDFSRWQQQSRQLLRQSYLGPKALPAIKAELQSREDKGLWLRERWRVQLVLPIWQEVWLLRPKATINPQTIVTQQATPTSPNVKDPNLLPPPSSNAVLVSKQATSAVHMPNKYPAVLLLHDHGAEFRIGKEKWFRHSEQTAISQPWSQRYFDGEFFADKLAAAGFIVLAGDAPGFGQRGPLRYAQQQQLAANMQAHGYSLAGLIALEDLQMAHFLANQAEVDKARVSAVGFSFGAYRVWQLAALSANIGKAVGVGWFNELQALRTEGGNFSQGQTSWLMIHPGLFQQLDMPDIAALASPKPLLIINGAKDPLMPAQGWLRATHRLCALYDAAEKNGCQQLEMTLWPEEGHVFSTMSQQRIIEFLQR